MTQHIPKHQIEFIVGRFHVGTAPEAIEADIRRRAVGSQLTQAQIEASVRYARKCHAENYALYKAVMGGLHAHAAIRRQRRAA